MLSRSPSPEFSPLAIGEDLTPLPVYKAAATTRIDFDRLLDPPLELHEDLKSGCGGQLWPAGMVLSKQMLRYHRSDMSDARMYVYFALLEYSGHVPLADKICRLELGAGGGLVGLAVAIGCDVKSKIYISDQENMKDLMAKNIVLNDLKLQVEELVLNWYVSNSAHWTRLILKGRATSREGGRL